MSSPISGSQTETYTYTRETVETMVFPRVITQSDQIAHYFTDDLEEFLRVTNINLAHTLQIPTEYPQDTKDIVMMLYDDLSHMLRDGLITGIHLLLSELELDPNSHAYPLRYHAMYVINNPERSLKPPGAARRFGGALALPKDVWRNTRFALLIDWNPSANERRRQARRPEYWFDWVPERARFDGTTLIRYREGGMTVDSATVTRHEAASPGYQ